MEVYTFGNAKGILIREVSSFLIREVSFIPDQRGVLISD